jgi:uncharacterized repeat protein (TIGR01451 family)
MSSLQSRHRFGRTVAVATSFVLAMGALVLAAPSAASAADPALTVTNSVNEAVAHPGDLLVYTISIVNTGTTDASGYYLHDYLSDDLTFVSATGSPGNINFFGIPGYTQTYIWFGSINVPQGQTLTETVTATVNAGTVGQSFTNGAFVDLGAAPVTHNTPCVGLPFNGSCAATTVTPSVPAVTAVVQTCTSLDAGQCDPSVDADWLDTPHFPAGSLATFRVVVSNTGDGDLTGVSTVVTTSLPLQGIPMVTAGSVTFPTWTIGSLAHAMRAILTFRARLPAGAGNATVSAQASGTGGTTAVADGGATTVTATPLLAETGIDLMPPFGIALLFVFVGVALLPRRRSSQGGARSTAKTGGRVDATARWLHF